MRMTFRAEVMPGRETDERTYEVERVLSSGRIVKSGGKELALELEAKGYDWVKETEPSLASA